MKQKIKFDPIIHRTKTIGDGVYKRNIITAEIGFKVGGKSYLCESTYNEGEATEEVERNLLSSALISIKELEKDQKSKPL